MKTLKVGDRVLWRGCFGTSVEKEATVLCIEHTTEQRVTEGTEVEEIDWQLVFDNYAVVTIHFDGCDYDNWAYGEQIKPLDFQGRW